MKPNPSHQRAKRVIRTSLALTLLLCPGLSHAFVPSTTYYVNDASTSGDMLTTATGNDVTGNGSTSAPYATLTKAISVAAAGDIIMVDAGTYAEDITVSKSLHILGPNANVDPCTGTRVAEAVIVPATVNAGSGQVVVVTASDVTISGFTIDGDNTNLTSSYTGTNSANIDAADGIAIGTAGVNNLTVSNNIIRNLSDAGVIIYPDNGNPATHHTVSHNKIQDLGTYGSSNVDYWGIGVLIYNNAYTAVTDNCIDNARIGVQTGNFNLANTAASSYQAISNNTITNARTLGIWHNLAYQNASPITVSGNSISGVANVNESYCEGIFITSLSVPSSYANNTISINAPAEITDGYDVWNVDGGTSAAAISGGSVSGVKYGVWVNNYDGYVSNAGFGGHATLSNISITPATNGIGIYLQDNVLATSDMPVQVTLNSGVQLNNGTDGIVIEGNSSSLTSPVGNVALSGQTGDYIRLSGNSNNIDATAATFGGVTGAAATLAQNFAIEDKILHKIDNSALGFVIIKANNDFVTSASGSVQRGIDAASSGYTVNVDAGTFNENLTVNKSLTLQGAGSTTVVTPSTACSGNGITITAANTTVKDIKTTNFTYGFVIAAANVDLNGIESSNNCGYGVELSNGISYLSIENSKINNNTFAGLRAGTGAQMNHITIDNCEVKGNVQGAFIAASSGGGNSFDNILIRNSDFSNNTQKGMYFEKLSNAVIANVTMNNSGTDPGYNTNAGIDINLKYGSYSNITIRNSSFSNCGVYGSATAADAPVVMCIKARDDASSYNSNPATLSNVSVLNNFISGPQNGIRFGEFGKTNNTPTNVQVHENSFGGTFANKAIVNNTPVTTNASCNWWSTTSGTAIAAALQGSVTYSPYFTSGTDNSADPGFQPVAATIVLSSASGTDAQTRCVNTSIVPITYATTGVSGVSFTGLPAGVTGSWAGNVATISGTPTATGTFNYTVSTGCNGFAGGTITVVNSTLTASLSVSPQYPMSGQEIRTIYLDWTTANGASSPSAQSEILTVTPSGGNGGNQVSWSRSACEGSSSALSQISGASAASYTWSPTSADICSGNNDNRYYFAATVTDNTGCAVTTTPVRLNVVNPWTTTPGTSGSVQVCHKVAVRGGSVNQLMVVTPSQVATHLAHGDQFGNCTVFTGSRATAPEEAVEGQQVAVYPNPTTGQFTLELSEVRQSAVILITDIAGKVIATRSIAPGETPTLTFDLNNYAKGLYLISVRDGDFSYRTRLVVQ